jgi:transcription antitermination factor NusG
MNASDKSTVKVCDKYYAIKVRSCSEMAIADGLRKKGYAVLSPSYIEKRQYSDRVRKTDRALFPGYVFVSIDISSLLPLVSTDGVSYVVKTGHSIQPLPDKEVILIESLCKLRDRCRPFAPLQVGQRIAIESGPLSGLEGILVRIGDKDRIVLSVDSVFQSVSVDLHDTKVKALE